MHEGLLPWIPCRRCGLPVDARRGIHKVCEELEQRMHAAHGELVECWNCWGVGAPAGEVCRVCGGSGLVAATPDGDE